VDPDAVRVPEFGAELTEDEWAELTQHGHYRRLPTGTPLFLEGTYSDTVLLVISGRVKVFSSAADDRIAPRLDLGKDH